MRSIWMLAMLTAVAAPISAQSVSPYSFAGVRLPMTAKAIAARTGHRAMCTRDRTVRITTCKLKAYQAAGGDSGTYDATWEINDPTGRISAIWFDTPAQLSSAFVQPFVERWGHPAETNSSMVEWGGQPGDRWMADLNTLTDPLGVVHITLRDVRELNATNRREAAAGQ